MEINEKIENQKCRACYKSIKGLKLLKTLTKCLGSQQQKSYAELLKEVSNINIFDDVYGELLPQLICERCARRLKTAHAFIEQIHEVNERLMSIARKGLDHNEFPCLQEPSVDILPIGDIIKSESEKLEGLESLGLLDTQCFVELKGEGQNKLDGDNTSEDVKQNETLIKVKSPENDKAKVRNKTKMNPQGNIDFFSVETENYTDSESADWNEKSISQDNIKDKRKHDVNDDIAALCSDCNKIFCNSKALARHKRNTHIPEEKKCACSLCGRKFSRSCNMYKHMRAFHGPDSVPLVRKPSIEVRIYQCEKCEKNYTKRSYLNVHINEKHNNKGIDARLSDSFVKKTDEVQAHKKEKPLCSICGISFTRKTHLVVHMRRHTGERPFKCDLCERAYPRLSELVSHRRIHTGEKPFKCKICDKAFRLGSKMRNHMRSHTDIQPYKCTQCERGFKYSKNLNVHFRIHTGERPYKCNVCDSTFTQSNTLKAHRLRLGHIDDVTNVKNNVGRV